MSFQNGVWTINDWIISEFWCIIKIYLPVKQIWFFISHIFQSMNSPRTSYVIFQSTFNRFVEVQEKLD
jgi:hypothetical protein